MPVKSLDQHIMAMARQSTEAQSLMQLPGIGETTATALLSTIGNGRDFQCGRQLCAWLGLVPATCPRQPYQSEVGEVRQPPGE